MNALILAFNLWAGAEATVIEQRYASFPTKPNAIVRSAVLEWYHPQLMSEFSRRQQQNRRLEQWLERQEQARRTFPYK